MTADWETLRATPLVSVRRRGRHLVADLHAPHVVLSTSARNGGQVEHVRHLVNHQSCEGAGHDARFHAIIARGPQGYHDEVCAEVGLPPGASAVMGTAANMSYAALVTERDGDVEVSAVVTAGVQTNATCAGDPATWREAANGMEKVAGTINTLLLIDRPLVPAALATSVVVMTEAKSAALQRLAVPSRYSSDLATGTGTDQYAVAAPLSGGPPLTSASPHLKLGEMIGRAVRQATLESLRWQNGLEPSVTRGVFHALGRYGLSETTFFEDIADRLERDDLDLLRKNVKAALYDPHAGAAAHALAAVLDRARFGTLPDSVARDAVVHQAALLAASLAARLDRWASMRERLQEHAGAGAKAVILSAIALGWREKWRPA
jgi:adenosylcobinamide amidohydrolase